MLARPGQLRVLTLAFVAFFASAPGQSYLIAVFVDEFLAGTGLSRTAFSALYAAATVGSATAMIVVGRAIDRFGARAAWIGVSASLALACGVASVAAGAVVALVALTLLRTFGQGSFPLLGTLLVARAFRGRRGRAMAVASMGLTAASTVLPPLVILTIVELGWREAYRVLGLAVLVLVLPLAGLLAAGPASAGAAADAADEPGADEAFPPALRRSRRLPRVEVPTRRAAELLLVVSAPPLVITAVVFHAVSLLTGRGLSLHEAGAALSVLGAASAAGTLLGGAVADRVSTRALLAAMSAFIAGSALVLLLPGAAVAFVAFALLGLGGGLFGVASGLVWARTYGLGQLGKLQGASFAAQITAAAAGPLPLAASLALAGSYLPALAALGGFSLLALAVAARWRPTGG